MRFEVRPPLRRDSSEACIPELGWEQSGGESVPAVAGIVCRLLQRLRAAAKPGHTGRSVDLGGPGQAQDLFQGAMMGLAGCGLARHFRSGTRHQCRHPVDEACCWPGALRGRSPRTREGRIGPTAQNCSGQWLVGSGQRLRFPWLRVDREMVGAPLRPKAWGSSPPFWNAPVRRDSLPSGNPASTMLHQGTTPLYDPTVMVPDGQVGVYRR